MLFRLTQVRLITLNACHDMNRNLDNVFKIFGGHGLKECQAVEKVQHFAIGHEHIAIRFRQVSIQVLQSFFGRNTRDVTQQFEKASDGKTRDACREALLGDGLNGRTCKDAHFLLDPPSQKSVFELRMNK